MRKSDRALINNLLLLVALFWPVALQIDAAETATVGGGGLPARAAGAKARLLFPEQVLAGFTNGVDRVRVIVNLVPSARALQPTDWHAAQSRRSLPGCRPPRCRTCSQSASAAAATRPSRW